MHSGLVGLEDLGFRVLGLGFGAVRVKGLGFRVQSWAIRVKSLRASWESLERVS